MKFKMLSSDSIGVNTSINFCKYEGSCCPTSGLMGKLCELTSDGLVAETIILQQLLPLNNFATLRVSESCRKSIR